MSCFTFARKTDTSQLIIYISEAPGACWCKAGRNIGACVCDLVCVMETMHLQIHSANECEAGTQETPTAVHIQGLMNLSKGK